MRTFSLLLPVFVAACTTPGAQLASILPDDRLSIDEAAFSDAAMRGVGESSEYYATTRSAVTDTNTMVGDVLSLIEAITSFDPTWSDEESTALWGPWLDDGMYGQLWVREEADGSYSWAIELRPEASDETAWVGVLNGIVAAGATDQASAGEFVLDLTALEELGGGDGTTGTFSCVYDLSGEGSVVDVGFGQIADGSAPPADGMYHYEQTRGVGGLMDLAVEANLDGTETDTIETLIIRSRWQLDGQGRADAYVTGGDLGALTYTETDCWDRSHSTVFFENNFELLSEGDPSACAFAEPSFND
ncbi:MAG: hypothetical protein ABMA64_22840 [Myxococcota bacterium]